MSSHGFESPGQGMSYRCAITDRIRPLQVNYSNFGVGLNYLSAKLAARLTTDYMVRRTWTNQLIQYMSSAQTAALWSQIHQSLIYDMYTNQQIDSLLLCYRFWRRSVYVTRPTGALLAGLMRIWSESTSCLCFLSCSSYRSASWSSPTQTSVSRCGRCIRAGNRRPPLSEYWPASPLVTQTVGIL